MARIILKGEDVTELKAWAVSENWSLEPPGAQFEVFRTRSASQMHPVIFYRNERNEDLAVSPHGNEMINEFYRLKDSKKVLA